MFCDVLFLKLLSVSCLISHLPPVDTLTTYYLLETFIVYVKPIANRWHIDQTLHLRATTMKKNLSRSCSS